MAEEKTSYIFTHRLAEIADSQAIKALMGASITELQKDFLTPEELSASHDAMGLDTSLITDGTYFVILHGEGSHLETIVGCGGWGKRVTLYGGDHTGNRSDALLDPTKDPARIRAMYTHPDWARRGVGRLILTLSEAAAKAAGFGHLVMAATLSGKPLYEAYGFKGEEKIAHTTGCGENVPLIKMSKKIEK